MIVKWTKTNINYIPVKGKGHIVLLPGCNEVDNDLWAAVRDELAGAIRSGILVEVNAVKKDGKLEVVPFAKLPPEKAEQLVEETVSTKTLDAWKTGEGRDSVRARINKRLDTVNKRGKKAVEGDA